MVRFPPKRRPRGAPEMRRREAVLAVLVRLRFLVRAMRDHYRQVERSCGVSGAYVWAMTEIDASPGVKVGELAQRLGLHQSTASNMVEKLEKLGLLLRTRAPDDQRVVQLYLT